MKRLLPIGAIAALVGAPAAWAARTDTTPTTRAPAGTPTAPAMTARARLFLPGIFVVRREAVAVPGRAVVVQGVVRPYAPGQFVTVTARLGHRVIRHARLAIVPLPGATSGQFTERVSSPAAGRVVVTAVHERTEQMRGFTARRGYAVLAPSAGFGSTGRFVQLIQQRLAALHFYIPQTGVYDAGTGLAIDAYHRLLHQGTSQALDGRTISYLLNGWGEFRIRYPKQGRHAEGDLGLQLLALADGPNVQLIFPISSGKPSTPTVLGTFRVYSRVPGYLPDGMYYSNFFTGGYAIHGYDPAPDYPASHGCMRLPIADAITAYRWLALGDTVDVYY